MIRVDGKNWKTDGFVIKNHDDGSDAVVIMPKNYPQKHPKIMEECPFCKNNSNCIYVTSVKTYENEYYHSTCNSGWSNS